MALAEQTKLPSITNLQALRALAALNVVLFHCIGAALIHGYPLPVLGVLDGWGANGVDIFFVISGFVMIYTQWRKPRHPYNFALNRVLRLTPIYWILTTLFLALVTVLPTTLINTKGQSFWSAASSYLFVSKIVSGQQPVIYVGWTLEYEMAFYAIFGMSIFIRRRSLQILFSALCISFIVAFLPYSPIAFEFLFGMLLGAFYVQGGTAQRPIFIIAAGLGLLAASIGTEIASPWRPIVWGIPALLIVLGSLYLPQTRSKVLGSLGDASYSIYLAQAFTIPIVYKALLATGIRWNGDALVAIAVALSAIGGLIVYYLLELPITTWIRRRNPQFARSALYPTVGRAKINADAELAGSTQRLT